MASLLEVWSSKERYREREKNKYVYVYIYNIIITYIYIPTPVIIMGAHRKAVVGTAFKDWGFV